MKIHMFSITSILLLFVGVHDNSLDDLSTKYRRRAMPKTRASSVVCERIKPSPLSPTGKIVALKN